MTFLLDIVYAHTFLHLKLSALLNTFQGLIEIQHQLTPGWTESFLKSLQSLS